MDANLFSLFDLAQDLRRKFEDAVRGAHDAVEMDAAFAAHKRELGKDACGHTREEEEARLAMARSYVSQELKWRERLA
jgi:hypothetical protein